MPDDNISTDQSMDETLKELERQLGEGDEPEGQPSAIAPQSAEILNLAEAAGDSRKGRSQNRTKASPGAESGSLGPEAANRTVDEHTPPEASAAETATPPDAPVAAQRRPLGAARASGGGATGTLEDVMRGLMRPMLQNWVDQKLEGIVDELVRAELAKALEEAGVS
jgi:cell pole-organizing protein PopZ